MKPTDVTDEMLDSFLDNAKDGALVDKEIIAASVNAVLGDSTPITAERLVSRGYQRSLAFESYDLSDPDGVSIIWNTAEVSIFDGFDSVEVPSVKTIGQLRALEIGLGIKQ